MKERTEAMIAREREEARDSWRKETRKQVGVPRRGTWLSAGSRERAWHWDQRRGMLMLPWKRRRRVIVPAARRMGGRRR
jgi:hypothetical protein